ncbi:MAG: hypothetical protein BGP06_16950 [Rhizobiales bacterium 65-9]|nr:MAG: hypothetical protein BGP06_16950 [Rhizobiales bacterium 65-9]
MIVGSGDRLVISPQDATQRLAESLRAPGAFAVDADTGAPIAPPDASPLGDAARDAVTAFARDQRGAAAALLDLALDGAGAPATPCACRMMPLDGRRRAVVVVPIDGGLHQAAAVASGPVAQDEEAPPVRILWQSDAEGRITHIGDQLRRMVGDQAGVVAGRLWTDLVGDVMLDPAGEIAPALARRETASGVELLWSSDREAGPATLLWSGVPVFDSGRRFRGFRGFLLAPAGLLHTAEMMAREARRQPDAPKPAVAGRGEESAAPETIVQPPLTEPVAPPALPPMPHLSSAERNAFREIARALGVRGADEDEPAGSSGGHDPVPRREAAVSAPEMRAPDIRGDDATAVEPDRPASSSDVAQTPAADPVEPVLAESPEHAAVGPAVAPQAFAAAEEVAAPDFARTDDETPETDTALSEAQAPLPANDGAVSPDFETIHARVSALAAALAQAEQRSLAQEAARDHAAKDHAAKDHAAKHEAAESGTPAPAAEPTSPVIEPAPAEPIERHGRDILDRLPVGVLVNRGPELLFVNRTLMDLLDYPSAAAIEAHGGVAGLFKGRAPISDRDGPTGPMLLNSREGDSVAVDARLQSIEWDDGPATLVTFRRALDVEINQRLKATELDLRAREAELRETRAVLDIATDGVALIDEDGRIMTLNRAAEALFGYEQNEVAGESVTILFAPESHAQVGDYFEGLKSGGVRSVLNDGREIVGRVRQGGRVPLFVTFGQISDRPSRKFCAVIRDLTNWKKTERDLVEARKAAEDASAQKSDFLAKISHEVRTPLNAIIGFAEVMMEERFGAVGNDRYKEYLRDIHASGGHVISLVNDLLDLSKIEAGKLELEFTSVNVNEIVRGAVNLMQPQSQRARVVVRSALAGKLPLIVADERSLKQIIINLLSNAVKFTDSGGQVIVSSTLTDLGEIAIRIRDTGIGMSEKELGEAMEPFRQLATSRRAGGTGLGLPLTRALVEANRAHLKLSSVKNEGTLVEVVFPPTRVLAE